MATIKIRNERPVQTTKETAERILKLWNSYKDDKKNNHAFTAGGLSTTVSQIISVNLSDDPEENKATALERKMDRDNQQTLSNEQEYRDMRARVLKLDPEVRAKNKMVSSFLKMAFAAYEFVPTDEQRVEIYKRAVKFYRENPNNIYPNTAILKDMVPTKRVSTFADAGVRLVERVLSTDYEYARMK